MAEASGPLPATPAPESAALALEGVTKRFGSKVAVRDLDLAVRRGEVFGYIGPNGAGKTTTIRLLLDLMRPTSGRVFLLGRAVAEGGAGLRRRVGYLPGELALYEHLTGRQLVDFLAGLRGGADPAWVRELAERLDLDLGRRIGVLSRGNKQKVGLVQALAHRPELAILDEPTSGLDPLVQQEVYGIVDELRAGGTTVFFSSHVLSEVDRVADRVGMIRAGRLIDVDDVGALRARALRRVEVRFADPVEPGAFANLPGVREVRAAGERASFAVEGSVDPLIKALAGLRS